MRYFVVTYAKKPNGQIDEAVSVEAKIKNSTLSTATVILDYKERKVVKIRLPEDREAAKDFEKIHEYYVQHYKTLIEGIEAKFEILKEVEEMDIKELLKVSEPLSQELVDEIGGLVEGVEINIDEKGNAG